MTLFHLAVVLEIYREVLITRLANRTQVKLGIGHVYSCQLLLVFM